MRVAAGLGMLVCAMAPVFAGEFAALRPAGVVSDFARVVDQRTRDHVSRYSQAVEAATGVRLAFVTLESLGGEPVRDVATLLLEKWDLHRDRRGAVLLLLAIREERLWVAASVSPGLLPEDPTRWLIRKMDAELAQRDYPGALRIAAQTLGSTLAASGGVRLAPLTLVESNKGLHWPLVVLCGLIAAGGVLLLWWRSREADRHEPARSGGGFGGYDSADSCGAFGGSDRGGSSRW